MPKIYVKEFFDQLEPELRSGRAINAAYQSSLQFFNEKKDEMLTEFDDHPVTKDILNGPFPENNISRTLSNVKGNLFSFIGFEADSNPIHDLRDTIDKGIKLSKDTKYRKILRGYVTTVDMIKMPELYKKFKYPVSKNVGGPWAPGSWVKGIETGISGLGEYLTLFHKISSKQKALILKLSRSGAAVQLKDPKSIKKYGRSTTFRPVPYLTQIFNRFQTKFRGPRGRFI